MSRIFLPKTHSLNWSRVRFEGPDAKDFLHRLTTVDVKNLQPGHGTRGLLLTPQGKVQAYFSLWNFATERYHFEFDAGRDGAWKKQLLDTLAYFHFGEKWSITDESDSLSCMGWLGKPPVELGENRCIEQNGFSFTRSFDRLYGQPFTTVWGPESKLRLLAGKQPELNLSDLQKLRIENGTPWVDSEITASSNPLELGLQDAIADQKGCYPGQEVIEKIIALGSPAKRLCTVQLADGTQKLALVSKTQAKENAVISDAATGNQTVVKVWVKE